MHCNGELQRQLCSNILYDDDNDNDDEQKQRSRRRILRLHVNKIQINMNVFLSFLKGFLEQ